MHVCLFVCVHASQEICFILSLRCVHKGLQLVPILSQMNSTHALPSSFFKIDINISICAYVVKVVSFLQVSAPKPICLSVLISQI
jgi:hypothetical protein